MVVAIRGICLCSLVVAVLGDCASDYRASPQQRLHAECIRRHEGASLVNGPGEVSLACQRWAARVVRGASLH